VFLPMANAQLDCGVNKIYFPPSLPLFLPLFLLPFRLTSQT